jgi:hypothetical protein
MLLIQILKLKNKAGKLVKEGTNDGKHPNERLRSQEISHKQTLNKIRLISKTMKLS